MKLKHTGQKILCCSRKKSHAICKKIYRMRRKKMDIKLHSPEHCSALGKFKLNQLNCVLTVCVPVHLWTLMQQTRLKQLYGRNGPHHTIMPSRYLTTRNSWALFHFGISIQSFSRSWIAPFARKLHHSSHTCIYHWEKYFWCQPSWNPRLIGYTVE